MLGSFRGREGVSLRASAAPLARLIAATAAPPATEPPAPSRTPGTGAGKQPSPATGSKGDQLDALRPRALACQRCEHLVASRTQVVFGVGNPDAELMFIGEAPGAEEDARGEPFVGPAGQLLTKIIQAMGLTREEVYIANILKCRPDLPPGSTGNRKPTPEEMATCFPWLREQIGIIQPKAMVALGATAAEGLLGMREPMRELRGRWHRHEEIPVMVTYHPSYLIRNQSPGEKRKVWEDMLAVMERLEMPISPKQRRFFRSATN